jgi:hypothetical protein
MLQLNDERHPASPALTRKRRIHTDDESSEDKTFAQDPTTNQVCNNDDEPLTQQPSKSNEGSAQDVVQVSSDSDENFSVLLHTSAVPTTTGTTAISADTANRLTSRTTDKDSNEPQSPRQATRCSAAQASGSIRKRKKPRQKSHVKAQQAHPSPKVP